MSVTNFAEYARNMTRVLETILETGEALVTSLNVDQRSAVRGFIAGSVQFNNGATLGLS